jgi:hypothetical protein
MLDYLQYEIRCPYCGHLGYQQVRWLLKHPQFLCPEGCGETISSPIVDLSEFIPVSMPSRNDLDLSHWEAKKTRRAVADRTSGRDRNVREKTPRGRAHR